MTLKIKPYYETELGKLYNADNMDVLPHLQGDLLLTDPPYNISRPSDFRSMGKKGTQFEWEWDKDFDIKAWIKPAALCAPSAIVFNSMQNVSYMIDEFENKGFEYKRPIVLSKSNPVPFNAARLPLNSFEFGFWSVRKKFKWVYNGDCEALDYDVPCTTHKWHPTEKDLDMIRDLVLKFTDKGQTVIDPFGGGGTTAEACEQTGRKWILIEKEKEYCEKIVERLKEIQPMLF